MKRVERETGRNLVDLLVEQINQNGLSETAEKLDISKATLGYWVLKLDIKIVRIALKPGQKYQIIEER